MSWPGIAIPQGGPPPPSAESGTIPPLVSFKSVGVEPPSQVYIMRDDALGVLTCSSLANVKVAVRGRILLPNGVVQPFAQFITDAGDRTPHFTKIQLSEGFLLSVEVNPETASVAMGQVYCGMALFRPESNNTPLIYMLASGYTGSAMAIGFPSSGNKSPLEGPGNIRSITGTTPAAGAEITETVPVGARWRLISFSGRLSASAAVANRVPIITMDDGTNIYFQNPYGGNVAASNAPSFYWAPGINYQTNTFSQVTIPIMNDPRLDAGHRIRTVTQSIQAADQWSLVQYVVEEWLKAF